MTDLAHRATELYRRGLTTEQVRSELAKLEPKASRSEVWEAIEQAQQRVGGS